MKVEQYCLQNEEWSAAVKYRGIITGSKLTLNYLCNKAKSLTNSHFHYSI